MHHLKSLSHSRRCRLSPFPIWSVQEDERSRKVETESSLGRSTAVSSEAWAKLREWAILAGKGRLLLSGSVVLASLKAAVD